MEQLKLYAAPLVALVLVLLWFFVISPMLDEPEPAGDEPATGEGEGEGEGAPATTPAP